jgi:hypothetical protein
VIAQGGAQIHTAVSGSPNTPPFTASIISTGVRLVPIPAGLSAIF